MTALKPIKITILPGDGIGQKVMQHALPILEHFDIGFDLSVAEIGWSCWQKAGNPVPQITWDLIHSADATLLGAITSKPYREAIAELPIALQECPPPYISPIIQLRQKLDLYANIRPCFSITKTKVPFNLCIIRENTEGLYSGLDFAPINDELLPVLSHTQWANTPKDSICASLRVQTTKGLKRIFTLAFEYAKAHGFSKVTLADKPNVLRQSSAFARDLFEQEAALHQDIEAEILNVDAIAHWLVKKPEMFGVIVAENMFGDILSDVAAAVMGGLGFAPSANIGSHGCYFEPVHGSGLNISNDEVNPSAMFLSIAMMLNYLGYDKEARLIQQAVLKVVREKKVVTYDVDGLATTAQMAQEIIKNLR